MFDQYFIIYMIINFIFILLLKDYFEIFLVKKHSSRRMVYLVWFAFYVSQVFAKVSDSPVKTMIYSSLCFFILMQFLYKGNIKKKLIVLLILDTISVLVEVIVGYLLSILQIDNQLVGVIGSILSKMIILVIFKSVGALYKTKFIKEFPLKYWAGFLFINFCSIYLMYHIFVLSNNSINNKTILDDILSALLILIFNLFMFHIYDKLSEEIEVKKKNIMFEQQLELIKIAAHEREEALLNLRKREHDIRNHLICLKEYIRQNEIEEFNQYMDYLLEEQKLYKNSIVNSGNVVIDSLLNYKYQTANKLGIQLKFNLEIPYKLPFDDGDLCIILGNAMDNAMEACSRVEREAYIAVFLLYRQENLLISVKNPYTGEIRRDNDDNIVTTKEDKNNHGIGLYSIKKVTDKYKGLVSVEDKDNIFELKILLYSES